jgi:hypothetical protein
VRVLDCTWLTGRSNCYWPLYLAAQACVVGQNGTLSPDGTQCTFSSGAVVTFAMPLTAGAAIPGFSIYPDDGGACLSGSFLANGTSVTTTAGTVTFTLDPTTETFALTCPDGTVYAGSSESLSRCTGSFPGFAISQNGIEVPADSGATGQIYLGIALAGDDLGVGTPLFGCFGP